MVRAEETTRSRGPFLISCLGVELELALLPHFLRHYEALGVAPGDVLLILNTQDAGSPRLAEAEAVLRAHGAPAPVRWIAPYTSDAMWAERRALQREKVPPGAWVLNADVDEFHAYPAPLGEITAYCDAKGYNCVQGVFVDRLAPGGALAPVLPEPAIEAQFPIEAEVALSLGGRGRHHGVDGTVKIMAHKADVLPSRGGHNPSAEGAAPRFATGGRLGGFDGAADPSWRLAFPFQVHHYKWTETLRESLTRRLATPGVSPAGKEYGEKIAAMIDRHGGVDLDAVHVGETAGTGAWRRRLLAMRAEALAGHLLGRARARLPGSQAHA